MSPVSTKKELIAQLGISSSTLRRWLNEMYYEDLYALGYRKGDRILKPQVVHWLMKHLVVDDG